MCVLFYFEKKMGQRRKLFYSTKILSRKKRTTYGRKVTHNRLARLTCCGTSIPLVQVCTGKETRNATTNRSVHVVYVLEWHTR